MKFSVCLIFLITIHNLQKTYSQNTPPVPGCSGCVYFGSTEEMCSAEKVSVSDLPEECTSLLFYDLRSDTDFVISDGTDISGNAEYIEDMLSSGKPSFLFYGHSDIKEWIEVLTPNSQDCGENAKIEMENLKDYLDQYNSLSGLVLQKLSIQSDVTCLPNFTANLKIYLDEMRTTFPDYGIGIELNGRKMVDYYSSQSSVEWLDFNVLDPCLDFYVINVYSFNICTENLKIGGTTPVSGDEKYTLEKLTAYIVKAGIPKKKTYFLYKTGPKSANYKVNACDLTNAKLCENDSLDGLCADNTQSYFDKGVFAQQNGAGFIAADVDLTDDPFGTCDCGSPYPAFYNMLDGFNCEPAPKACHLLDKN